MCFLALTHIMPIQTNTILVQSITRRRNKMFKHLCLLALAAYLGCGFGTVVSHPYGTVFDWFTWSPFHPIAIMALSIYTLVTLISLIIVVTLSGCFVFYKWNMLLAILPFLGFFILTYLFYAHPFI
jgi:hypothetical protein